MFPLAAANDLPESYLQMIRSILTLHSGTYYWLCVVVFLMHCSQKHDNVIEAKLKAIILSRRNSQLH